MMYFVVALVGLVGGALCVVLAMELKRRALQEESRKLEARADDLELERRDMKAKQQEESQAIRAKLDQLDQRQAKLTAERAELDGRFASYRDLQNENAILKQDLRNIDISIRKLHLDREQQQKDQDELDRKGRELGARYLKENVKWLSSSLNPNNFANQKQRLQDVVERCRGIGYGISQEEETALLADLRAEYEKVVRAAFEREEQARIKAQIREEQAREKELDRELKQLDREREAIQAALDKALAEAEDQHSEEIERLKSRLAEAEEKSKRAISQAQLTKSGHVYVISNIGSFGEGIFKIGMTRRLEPMDRVRELGDASVPFPFDVHMMISCDDAPSLENALHETLHKRRINRTNPRKEFFKSDIEAIRQIVEKHHGEVQYTADPEALEYRQSLAMSEEDEEFIESVYDKLEAGGKAVSDDD